MLAWYDLQRHLCLNRMTDWFLIDLHVFFDFHKFLCSKYEKVFFTKVHTEIEIFLLILISSKSEVI